MTAATFQVVDAATGGPPSNDKIGAVRGPSQRLANGLAETLVSTALSDPAWDAFLEGTPEGQYQQSSLWAQAKAFEGWKPIRVVVRIKDEIVGGFQILVRDARFLTIGYISKGPVSLSGKEDLTAFLVSLVEWAAKRNRLAALIIQPPDESRLSPMAVSGHHFLPNHLHAVVSATLLVELGGDFTEVEKRMRTTTLKQVHRAQRRGVLIREGGEADIPAFFGLMVNTCERQKTKPSPATEAALLAVWKAFEPVGGLRLTFADVEGQTVAGLLCFCFGGRVSAWKKGWSGGFRDRYPNVLVSYEAIQWAQLKGFKLVDFMGFSRDLALRFEAGESPLDSQQDSLYWFNLGFGSRPKVLPESVLYLSNPLARWGYRALAAARFGRHLAKRLVRGG